MLLKLFLLFTLIPIAEVYLLIEIGERIGFLNTVLIVVLTGVTGASFAKSQGGMIIGKIKANLNQGVMPREEMVEGVLILAGGIMLITPGIMTDIFGLSLIFPLTRLYYGKILIKYFKNKFNITDFPQTSDFNSNNYNSDDDNIIDV